MAASVWGGHFDLVPVLVHVALCNRRFRLADAGNAINDSLYKAFWNTLPPISTAWAGSS